MEQGFDDDDKDHECDMNDLICIKPMWARKSDQEAGSREGLVPSQALDRIIAQILL